MRLAFHDAGTFSNEAGAMKSGANGCMRFEEVHGSAPNSGLAFGLDSAPKDMIQDWLLLDDDNNDASGVGTGKEKKRPAVIYQARARALSLSLSLSLSVTLMEVLQPSRNVTGHAVLSPASPLSGVG